jgi:predicted Zn-dependent protease
MSGTRSLTGAAPVLGRAEAEAIAQKALSFATADETRVTINSGSRANTRFAVNQVSTAGDASNVTVSVLSAFGTKRAVATSNRLDEASLREVVKNAEALAKLSPEDPEAMPELGPQTYEQPKGWSEATAQLDPTARAAAVKKICDLAAAEGLVATGFLDAQGGALAIANSKGLFAYGRSSEAALTTTVRTADGRGSGWAGGAHWDWTKIDFAALGRTAIEKAKLSRDPVAIEPGRYTVVLEPTAVGNLVQFLRGAMNARTADEGRSFFTKPGGGNKVGMKVVDERVSLWSDPLDPDTYDLTFGGDGLPSKRMSWIENGVVKNLLYDRYWAKKQGVEPTGLGGGLKMSGGDQTIEQLIASTQRGILVTRFWYIRPVDPRTILYTGLTRDGTFLIENGKVTKAVKNLRFNESPVFLLNNVEAMSRPVRVSAQESGQAGNAVVVPAIKARDFSFTSLSDAV